MSSIARRLPARYADACPHNTPEPSAQYVVMPLNAATLDDAVSRCAEWTLTEADVDATCEQAAIMRAYFYDLFSRHVAHGFDKGLLSFKVADAAMNNLRHLALYDVPEYTDEVYSAFDRGEWLHPYHDPAGADPAQLFTVPWIREIVARENAA